MIIAPAANSLLNQRFVLEQQIGAGAMGMVFRARDTATGATVALKLMLPHGDVEDAERFAREAQLLAEIQHPHIVSYVDHGVSEQGQPYLAMEWLEGEDLAQLLARRRPGLDECVALLHSASAALAEAHQRGIMHRDLKPGNLFLRGGDMKDVIVLDFGLARRMLRSGSLTRAGVILGTPEYMAPEQARGEHDVGLAADIFSLGCVLYECITGRAPFTGEHVTAILVKVLLEDPPRVEALRPGVPPALSDLIARMLHKEPDARFADGLALHEAVRHLDLTPAELAAPAPAGPPAIAALTPHEQLFFSVAVAVLTDPKDRPSAVPPALREALRELVFSVELLADRSLVATVLPAASAADQALRAARCGLLMKRHMPAAEVAVATGRGRLTGQTPIGEAIDRALELLSPADPAAAIARPSNRVWLDALSENLLAGRLDVVHHGGRAQLVGEQKATTRDDQRRLLGQPAPFVGRDQELGTLESLLSACIGDSVAHAVGVIAPPGLGKSRLRHEFVLHAVREHPDLVVALGRGDLMHAGASYGIVGQALRELCGLVGDEPPAVQRQRLRARLGLHLVGGAEADTRVIHFLGELCGVGFVADGDRALQAARRDPKVMHDQVTEAFIEWLRCECQRAPVLLVLEDLHWGDALTVQLLLQTLAELAELPLMLLALARPEVEALFPQFWNARVIQELPLRPLSRRAAERLAHEVLGRAVGTIDAAIIGRIVDQGAGHPLFLEELIRSVAERRGDALPETILAMLLARLSQLDPGARRALRAASVFGETFTRAGVTALLGAEAGDDAGLSLAALVRAECVERTREVREYGAERYKFRHALVRDAAYSLLTDDNRIAAHRLAGAHLEQVGGVDPAVLGEHALRGQESGRAAGFFVEAAKQALRRHDPESTERYARRALDCGVTDDQRGVVRAAQAWTCQTRMDLENAYAHGLEAVDALPPGSFWWAKALGICFYSFFMINRFAHIERLIDAFRGATPEPDARVAFLEAGIALSVFLTNVGQRSAAADTIAKMRQTAADLEPHEHGYLLLADAYRTCKLEPDLQHALVCARQALALVAHEGASFIQVMANFYLGVTLTALGASAAGELLLREGTAGAMRIREDFGTVVTHLTLGLNLVAQPDDDQRAEARAIAATYLATPQVGPAMHGLAHQILGQAQLAIGDLAGADANLCLALAELSPLPPSRLLIVPPLVDVWLRQGRVAEARALAEDGLRLIDEQGSLGHCELPVRLAVARARLADGALAAGVAALTTALAELRRRAAMIAEPALQRSYLEIPEHRELVALAGLHGLA